MERVCRASPPEQPARREPVKGATCSGRNPILLRVLLAISVLFGLALASWSGLHNPHGSLRVGYGVLRPGEVFLDGSSRMFQRISWHLGTGVRTWGTTYGMKFGTAYLTLQVTHVDRRWTPTQAGEDR